MTPDVPVVLTHPTNPALSGPVTFRLPNIFTTIAIQRRITELANAGRADTLPRLHPVELPLEGYRLCVMVATLEHVIETAPRGLYQVVGGKAVLVPGALVEFESSETDGVVSLIYTAYETWRERFRGARAGRAQGPDEQPGRTDDRPGGAAGGEGSADGAGAD